MSRGGRPDLAGPRLDAVRAPTLLVVGGHDDVVLALNSEAQARMRCKSRLAVVPGANHLFEESGMTAISSSTPSASVPGPDLLFLVALAA